MKRCALFVSFLSIASTAWAAGITPLPDTVTGFVGCIGDASAACVETSPGGKIRGGSWKFANPGTIDLCPLLPAGTYFDPAECAYDDATIIVGRADGGTGGFPQVPVICKGGVSTQLSYPGPFYYQGYADCVNKNGTRVWGTMFTVGGNYFPQLWDDANAVQFNSFLNPWYAANFYSSGGVPGITDIKFLDCSDDGRYCCGWYEWKNDNRRWPFVCDSQDAASSFEDCFGKAARVNEGEARCLSPDGSKVFVWRKDNNRTYVTNPVDPTTNLVDIGAGEVKYCNVNGSTAIGFTPSGGNSVGWVWKTGSGQANVAPPTGSTGTLPTSASRDCMHVGGLLQGGANAGYLWADGKHGAFESLTALRDSLDMTFVDYKTYDTVCYAESGRTFYCKGDIPGSTNRYLHCMLESGPRTMWNEQARVYPPYISQYCYYAYLFSIYAAIYGGNEFNQLAYQYGGYSFDFDGYCLQLDYDYWERATTLAEYQGYRYYQLLFEYYCFLFNYYGAPTQFGEYARTYALYGYQSELADFQAP